MLEHGFKSWLKLDFPISVCGIFWSLLLWVSSGYSIFLPPTPSFVHSFSQSHETENKYELNSIQIHSWAFPSHNMAKDMLYIMGSWRVASTVRIDNTAPLSLFWSIAQNCPGCSATQLVVKGHKQLSTSGQLTSAGVPTDVPKPEIFCPAWLKAWKHSGNSVKLKLKLDHTSKVES